MTRIHSLTSHSIRFLSFSHPYRSLSLPIVVRPGLRPSAPRTGRDGKGMRRGNEDGRYGWKVIEPLASLVAHFGSLLVTLIPFSSPPCRVDGSLPPYHPPAPRDTTRLGKTRERCGEDTIRAVSLPTVHSLMPGSVVPSVSPSPVIHSRTEPKNPDFFTYFLSFFSYFHY